MTIPSLAQRASERDHLARAADLFWSAFALDAEGRHAERDERKRELLAIAHQVGPEFWDLLVDSQGARFAKVCGLPPERVHEAEAAIVHTVEKLFTPQEFHLAISEPWGVA
jgi:hypothetical protein